jgi:hypothetical protein
MLLDQFDKGKHFQERNACQRLGYHTPATSLRRYLNSQHHERKLKLECRQNHLVQQRHGNRRRAVGQNGRDPRLGELAVCGNRGTHEGEIKINGQGRPVLIFDFLEK